MYFARQQNATCVEAVVFESKPSNCSAPDADRPTPPNQLSIAQNGAAVAVLLLDARGRMTPVPSYWATPDEPTERPGLHGSLVDLRENAPSTFADDTATAWAKRIAAGQLTGLLARQRPAMNESSAWSHSSQGSVLSLASGRWQLSASSTQVCGTPPYGGMVICVDFEEDLGYSLGGRRAVAAVLQSEILSKSVSTGAPTSTGSGDGQPDSRNPHSA